MIKTARQLKDLIRNMAKGDSGKSQLLIRNYAMERFLERIALSKYKNNFILKGGMLVSAMVGLENRSTMDIDTTIRNFPLDCEHAKQIVEEIVATPVDDNIKANATMWEFWESYRKKNSYAAGIAWETVMNAIRVLCDSCIA